MTEKTFAIRLPEESFYHVESFFNWVLVHLNPGIPTIETSLTITHLDTIYNCIKQSKDVHLSFNYASSECFRLGLKEITEEEHKKWVKDQSLELHIQQMTPGWFKVNFALTGPGLSQNDGINFGSEVLFTFYLKAVFFNGRYIFHFDTADKSISEPLEPDMAPIPVFAVFEGSYQLEKVGEEAGFANLVNSIQDNLRVYFEDKQNTNWFNTENVYELSDQMVLLEETNNHVEKMVFAVEKFTGGFMKPYSYTYAAVEVPTKNGINLFIQVDINIGRKYQFIVPPLVLTKKEVNHE